MTEARMSLLAVYGGSGKNEICRWDHWQDVRAPGARHGIGTCLTMRSCQVRSSNVAWVDRI